MDPAFDFQRTNFNMVSPMDFTRSSNPEPIFPTGTLSNASTQRVGKRSTRPARLSLPLTENTFIEAGCPTDTGIECMKVPWDELDGSKGSTLSALDLPPQPKTANALTRTSSLDTSDFDKVPGSQWRIAPGSYIAFSLDLEALDQPVIASYEASMGLVKLHSRPRKYLGLVLRSHSKRFGENVVEYLSVHLVGNSTPKGDLDHWAPIESPSPVHAHEPHPDPARAPLKMKAGSLFPWNGLRQWTTAGVELVVTHYHDGKIGIALDDDDLQRVEDYSADDYWQLRQLGSEGVHVPEIHLPAKVWRNPHGVDHNLENFFEDIEILKELGMLKESCITSEALMEDVDTTLVDYDMNGYMSETCSAYDSEFGFDADGESCYDMDYRSQSRLNDFGDDDCADAQSVEDMIIAI